MVISQVYVFIKETIDKNNMETMAEKLSKFGISLSVYQRAMRMEEIRSVDITHALSSHNNINFHLI